MTTAVAKEVLEATPKSCMKILEWNIRAQVTTMIKGSPSTAKSAVVAALAKKFNLLLIDQRVAQLEPEDFQGMPRINKETDRSQYVPFDWLPLEGDPIPKGYNGWLLFLDELNAGEKPVTKATYKILLDRMAGQANLHKNCAIVGAGNLDTDGALTEDMGTASQSRMTYIRMAVCHKGWLEHARENHFDHRITSFINFKPGLLYTFDPEKASLDDNYACYRTWEFVHRQLQQIPADELDSHEALVCLAGSISQGVAREFLAHCKLDGQLPKIDQIERDPMGVKVPSELGAIYAVAGALGHHATEDNCAPLIQYANRLPKEYQIVALREMAMRNRSLLGVPAMANWMAANAMELF